MGLHRRVRTYLPDCDKGVRFHTNMTRPYYLLRAIQYVARDGEIVSRIPFIPA